MRTRVALVLVAGVAFSAIALWLVFSSNHDTHPAFGAALNLVVAWSFIASGLVAWTRRPDNRFTKCSAARAACGSRSSGAGVRTASATRGTRFPVGGRCGWTPSRRGR